MPVFPGCQLVAGADLRHSHVIDMADSKEALLLAHQPAHPPTRLRLPLRFGFSGWASKCPKPHASWLLVLAASDRPRSRNPKPASAFPTRLETVFPIILPPRGLELVASRFKVSPLTRFASQSPCVLAPVFPGCLQYHY